MIGASGPQTENHSFRLSGASGPSILVRGRSWPGTAPAVAPVLLQADRQRHQGSQEHVSSILQLGISHSENEPRIAGEEFLEADLGFDPGQLGSRTEVHARAETELRVGAAREVQFGRVGETRRVGVGGPSKATMELPRRSGWPWNSRSRVT